MSKTKGTDAEEQALVYLVSRGLQWISSNYHCRWGEIDLIMREADYLVFVEVRARSSLSFGGAAASITFAKKQKLLKTASHYLLVNKINSKQAIRFDVFSFEGNTSKINWIKNAFGLDF